MPTAALCIVDIPLDDLPELPADHRDAGRRMEKRIQVIAQNRANAMKRQIATFEAWTQLYGALKASTVVKAPVLSRTMADRCDLAKTSGIRGGYFDGPLAWRLATTALAKAVRKDADKAYYIHSTGRPSVSRRSIVFPMDASPTSMSERHWPSSCTSILISHSLTPQMTHRNIYWTWCRCRCARVARPCPPGST